ncbi:MAG: methyltransferase domain-containing protein, partial [Bacteroidota bacterium]
EALSFYDGLAGEYDAMTRFEGRFERERDAFRTIVQRLGIGSALDAGCGTGFHALLLAQLGVRVSAVDISPLMVQRLRAHANDMGLAIAAEVLDLRDPGGAATKGVDAVFCMGNTLAHAADRDDLGVILRGFHRRLRPGGSLCLQILNYERILSEANVIQSIREQDGVFYVRFYEYGAERIRFHLLRLSRSGLEVTHSLNSVSLTPFLHDEIKELLGEAGFVNVRVFGDMALQPYSSSTSRDLVVLAGRSD